MTWHCYCYCKIPVWLQLDYFQLTAPCVKDFHFQPVRFQLVILSEANSCKPSCLHHHSHILYIDDNLSTANHPLFLDLCGPQ